ncbi:MAG TPA: hypothetical protein DC054_01795 [Blastocatellia bacterium]|nr:hypothetical protein [Blastocatellia bacterium]
MLRILEFSSYGLLLHGEPELGWRAFVLFMVGVFFAVLLFDEMAHRAIRAIRKHRRTSFVSRLTAKRSRIRIKLKRFLARTRR